MSNERRIIIDFLKKISSQDNRSTAAPYFYVIRTKVEIAAHDGCGDFTKYYDPEDPEDHYDSIEDYITAQKEAHEYDDMIEDDKEAFDDKMDSAEYNLTSYDIAYDWVEKGMFLTETDAKDHLKNNHYHYSKDANTYMKHCWRAPEMKQFFTAMFNYFEIPRGNLDINEIKNE